MLTQCRGNYRTGKHAHQDNIYTSPLADLLITIYKSPTRLLWEALSHITITAWILHSHMFIMTEGEIEEKRLPGRRRTAWIDDVRWWTVGGLPAARRIALDRLKRWGHKKSKNIVVRCLRWFTGPYVQLNAMNLHNCAIHGLPGMGSWKWGASHVPLAQPLRHVIVISVKVLEGHAELRRTQTVDR